MPPKKKMKKIKKSVKKNRNIKKLIGCAVALLVIALGIGAIILIRYFKTDGKFNIASIVVSGCEKYTEDEIIEISKIELGMNLYSASKAQIRENISELPYIEKVEIFKEYPSTLSIKVTERNGKYVAYAKDSSQYVKVDSNGYILEVINVANISEDIILFGINFEDIIELGQKITDMELKKVITYEKIKKIYDDQKINQKITSVEFKNTNVILSLNDKLNVILEDNSELEYKISLLDTILKELDGKAGVLNMTLDNPTYAAI